MYVIKMAKIWISLQTDWLWSTGRGGINYKYNWRNGGHKMAEWEIKCKFTPKGMAAQHRPHLVLTYADFFYNVEEGSLGV